MEGYTFPLYNGPTASNFRTTCAMHSKYECATALDFRHHISFVEGGKVIPKSLPTHYTIASLSTGKQAVAGEAYGLYDLQLHGRTANIKDSFEYTIVDQFENESDEATVDVDKSRLSSLE